MIPSNVLKNKFLKLFKRHEDSGLSQLDEANASDKSNLNDSPKEQKSTSNLIENKDSELSPENITAEINQ